MNLDTATDEEIAEDIIAHPDCGSQLEAIELAKRVMVRARAQANGLSPGDSGPSYGDAGLLAVDIVAKPDAYTTPMLALAKAYESQRERIADLEEDVERLRPKDKFAPVTLFEYDSLNTKVVIDTDSGEGLCIDATDLVTDSNVVTMLTKPQATELASALSEWAGLSVVDWRPICELKSGPVSALLFIPTDLGSDMECSHEGYLRNGAELQTFVQAASATHWAPLPKPPEAKP